MSESLELYKLLHNETIAEAMGKVLADAGIEYEIKRSKRYFDPSFAFNKVDPEVNLLLRPEDFSKANEVLKRFYEQQTSEVDQGYYLLSFSDKELIEVIRKQDEWGSFDVALAKRLLHERGIEITPDAELEAERRRLEELSKPMKAPSWLVLAGYVATIVGGFFGIIIGSLLMAKKTLPDGSKVPQYTASDVVHGQRMMSAGFIIFIIFIASALSRSFLRSVGY